MAASRVTQALLHGAAKPVVWVLALLPAAWLLYGAFTDNLGANPAEALIRSTGDWALRMLCVALAVTPLRELTGWQALARFRRLLGLFAFFYVLLHVSSYAWLDMGWDGAALVADIVQRPFILVGALAALVLLALAATSSKRMVRALGGRRWQKLHASIHAAAWLALLHFFWMRAAKNQVAEVGVYAAIIAMLQLWRVVRRWRARKA
ncbi:MAG: sulfite oxidase heme-binding subunit YedZ [Comamonas sp.]